MHTSPGGAYSAQSPSPEFHLSFSDRAVLRTYDFVAFQKCECLGSHLRLGRCLPLGVHCCSSLRGTASAAGRLRMHFDVFSCVRTSGNTHYAYVNSTFT